MHFKVRNSYLCCNPPHLNGQLSDAEVVVSKYLFPLEFMTRFQ